MTNCQLRLNIFHEAGLKQQEADANLVAGDICCGLYEYEKAMRYYAEAIKLYKEVGFNEGLGLTYFSIENCKEDAIIFRKHLGICLQH